MDASKGKECDTPKGSMGLSYPMLSRTNYTAWAVKMKVYMQAQGVWEAVESDESKAKVETKKDKMALAMMYQGIPEEMLLTIAEKKSAKEAWETIKTMSAGGDRVQKARVQTLKTELETLRMKDTDQLDEFCMKLYGMVTNIRVLGETVDEAYVVKKLLRAVPSKYLQIASTIEQFGNLEEMTVEETVGRLRAHDERLRGQSGQTESTGSQLLLTEEEWAKREAQEGKLLLTREEWIKRSGKGIADGKGRREPDSRGTRGGRDRGKVRCFSCNLLGHYASECRKSRKGKEPELEANLTQSNDEEPALLLTERADEEKGVVMLNEGSVIPTLSSKSGEGMETNVWYLDNGASNHMTGIRSKFKNLNESVTGQVRFGDGSTVDIRGKGSVTFKCKNGEERELRDVYYIPTLRNNIISLGQMSEEGSEVVLKGEYLRVYDKKERLLMKVKRSKNRLYKIILEDYKEVCLMTKMEEDSWLWHVRLGHVNFKALNQLSKEGMVSGVPRLMSTGDNCEGCLMGKQVRKAFPGQTSFNSTQALELIHGDICGPIEPATPAGNRYFLLLVDDFSRKMWVYMMKAKGEAFEVFKKFKAMVENKMDSKIKTFRTDRGGEFCSSVFNKFCEEFGIDRHYTAPYTPQQNGVVERRNRTVVAMARSILKGMNMPLWFWGEAVRHSVYLLNRLPTRALSKQTPQQVWSGKKPSLKYVRVFGCIAYMKVPAAHTKKLDDRSKVVVNLGKEAGTKAYRLYDPSTKSVVVSRDVRFDEKKEWTWEGSKKDGSAATLDVGELFPDLGESSDQGKSSEIEQDSITTPVQTREGSFQQTHDESGEPRRLRLLSEVYDETEEIELDSELLLTSVEDPTSYKEAMQETEWEKAMQTEVDAIEKNKTWVMTDLPPGQKVIGLKWVYKLKKDTDGKVVKHKARLVAKGYVQKYGIDFEEVFAPVTRMETVRLLLALAAKNGWEVHHMDVKSAFLNGEIQEEVYVSQPEGFEKRGEEHKVYRLLKALYGLRQAPRAWYARLRKCLEGLGFEKCPYEHAVYVKREGNECLIIGVYVDDLLVTGTSVENIKRFKEQMCCEFDMSDLGKLSYYLGIEVEQGSGYIELKQTAYAKKILDKAGLVECNPIKCPMESRVQLDKYEHGKAVDSTKYKSMVGGLRYLVHTRPDISYAVGIVSRFMERPTVVHQGAVKRILRYVKGTLNYGIVYKRGTGDYLFVGYSDSDLAGSLVDRRSTGGVAFYLNESLVTWISQKQRCVVLSTCEAEFMAATAAACQGIWLKNLLSQISDTKTGPVVIYVDNKSAIDLARNPVSHGRRKHIGIRYHFIRECVEKGEVVVQHIRSEEQRADILTKPLSTAKFEKLRELLGVKKLDSDV